MKKMIAVATALAAGLAVADQAPAPAAAAPAVRDFYVTDFYAPPPDWIPKQAIRDYSLNTRVPDLFWLKYGDAYTLALRIRPLAEAQLEKDFEVGLIDRKRADDARAFRDDREKNADCRTVGVFGLAVPADDFVSFSFKMKARGKAAGSEVLVYADGVATVSTAKDADADTPCRDGFKAYKATFPAKKGRKLTGVRIVVPASPARDPDEEYVFTDLCFHRAAPKARFDDLPPRRWIPKAVFDEGREATTNDVIPDIVAYVNDPSNAVDSIDLPVSGYVLRPQTDKEKDGGFKAEKVRATINGRECDALRVTLEKGSRCYLKFPAAFNALDYNTLTFYTKIDIAGPVNPRKLCGDTRPSLYGTDAATVNSFFDTFSFGVHSATKDPVDWCRFGVAQGLASWHWQDGAAVDPGWRAVYQSAADAQDDDDKDKKDEERTLPTFTKGESGPHKPTLTKKMTTPPKHYTEASLLRAMETAGKLVDDEELRAVMKENGIGRPSSRAGIIETLFKRHYIRRERKNLVATPTGIQLIHTIHEKLLTSVELTGQWEKKLRDIEHHKYDALTFINELKVQVSRIVYDVMHDNTPISIGLGDQPVVGAPCPKCHKGHIIKGKTAYGCSRWKEGCDYRHPF